MNAKLLMLAVVLCAGTGAVAQQDADSGFSKNRLDFMAFGNRGFLNFIYNRIVFEKKRFLLLPNVGLGVVPGSHDKDTIPGHLSFTAGCNLEVGGKNSRLALGLQYGVLRKYGGDKVEPTTPLYMGAVLGEVGYIRSFNNDETNVKISFTPILIGERYRQFINFPVGLSFCARL